MITGQVNFDSFKNYMKRDTSTGSTIMDAPSTTYDFQYQTTFVVPQSLGAVPMYRVYYEPFGNGSIWPAMGNREIGGSLNPFENINPGPALVCYANDTDLVINLVYSDNTTFAGQTFPVYWIIYRDYAHD